MHALSSRALFKLHGHNHQHKCIHPDAVHLSLHYVYEFLWCQCMLIVSLTGRSIDNPHQLFYCYHQSALLTPSITYSKHESLPYPCHCTADWTIQWHRLLQFSFLCAQLEHAFTTTTCFCYYLVGYTKCAFTSAPTDCCHFVVLFVLLERFTVQWASQNLLCLIVKWFHSCICILFSSFIQCLFTRLIQSIITICLSPCAFSSLWFLLLVLVVVLNVLWCTSLSLFYELSSAAQVFLRVCLIVY